MDFNFMSIYSSLAQDLSKSVSDSSKIIEELEQLSSFKSAEEAKEFLKMRFGIKDSVYKYSIGQDIVLTIIDNSEKYCAKILYQDEHISYSYKK